MSLSLGLAHISSQRYLTLGARFVEIQTTLFGTDHYYAVDQFNENDPRSNDVNYIRQCGEAQLASLQRGDPRAVWVLQGWLFVFYSSFWQPAQIDAYIGGLKRESLLVLDLISEATPAYEQTNSYHGSPWVSVWPPLSFFTTPSLLPCQLWDAPTDRMLREVLYLALPHFCHARQVWNVLHNFGGSTGIRGNLATVMTRP